MTAQRQKILMGVLIGFLLILSVTPALIGLVIREAAFAAVLQVGQMDQLSINKKQVNSGWFKSTATIDIDYTPFEIDRLINIQLNFAIQHGPLLFTDDGPKLGLASAQITPDFNNQELIKTFAQIPNEQPEVAIELLVPFDLSLKLNLTVSPINYTENGTLISFAGIEGELLLNLNQSAELSVSVGEILARENTTQFEFNLGGLKIDSYTEQINNLLTPSMVSIFSPTMSANRPFTFNATNISADYRMRESSVSQAIDIYQDLRIENVESELPIQTLSWTLEFNEVPDTLFRIYYKAMDKAQSQTNNDLNIAMMATSELGEQMGLLLIQNSLVHKNLLLTNIYGGDHSIDLNFNWEGIPDRNNFKNLDFEEIISALNIRLEITLDQQAIMSSQFADLIERYQQQGYVKIENGKLLLSAVIEDNTLIINEELVPIDQYF